jgi:hypothetical protein
MLYVPLLFYIFDRLSERFKAKKGELSEEKNHIDESEPEDMPHKKTEGD